MLPGGNVKAREKTVLEDLTEAYDGVFERYIKGSRYRIPVDEIYEDMYNHLEKDVLHDISYTKGDLDDFIHSKGNTSSNNYSQFLGFYTGCLLDLLTERNRAAGLSTTFYFDGKGISFDYLFTNARNVDKLIVDNFEGHHICSEIATSGDKVNMVVLMNIEGDCLGYRIGSRNGEAGLLISLNNKFREGMPNNLGSGVFFNSGNRKGKLGMALMLDDSYNAQIGSNIASAEGTVGLIGLFDSKVQVPLDGVARGGGKAKVVIAANNDSKYPLSVMCHGLNDKEGEMFRNGGLVEKAIVINSGPWVLTYSRGIDPGIINTAVIYGDEKQNRALHPGIINKIEGEQALEEYTKTMQEYRLDELLPLIRSMQGKDEEEIVETADKIYSIYEIVKPLLKMQPEEEK